MWVVLTPTGRRFRRPRPQSLLFHGTTTGVVIPKAPLVLFSRSEYNRRPLTEPPGSRAKRDQASTFLSPPSSQTYDTTLPLSGRRSVNTIISSGGFSRGPRLDTRCAV